MTDTGCGTSPSCEACPAHHAANLVKMGVDMADWDYVVALAGNPNVGKSTVFNALTGLRQHTGNWPGKTVSRAEGGFALEKDRFKLVDLPGTYSLLSSSFDEEIARDFILFGRPDVTLVVVDASRLERNLNLALQVLDITDRVVVCLNLMDEAQRRGLDVDVRRLSKELGVPVVATSARFKVGIDDLLKSISEVATGAYVCKPRRHGTRSPAVETAVEEISAEVARVYPNLPNVAWVSARLLDGDEQIAEAFRGGRLGELSDVAQDGAEPADRPPVEDLARRISEMRWEVGPDFHQDIVEGTYEAAAAIADLVVTRVGEKPKWDLDGALDRVLTSRIFGLPIMVGILTLVFWVTITGANVPSALLGGFLLETVHPWLKSGASALGIPWWIDGLLIDGMYLATAWVVSVMLPPMAIFFPLFTLAEDFGYLPRVAFNMDSKFKRVGAHGKQALTMTMGFGCNAAGVVATRIIESPRERLIAIVTNNFALCNGRWPTQILLATIFIGALAPAALAGLVSAVAVVAVALFGIVLTLLSSWFLSRTALRGEVSSFSLELPPYRPPRVLQTLYTSLIDRTVTVLWRAVVFALPAGAVIWLLSNVEVSGSTLAFYVVGALDPVGAALGLSGIILLAFVIAIPANEIVVPTILMLTVLLVGAAGQGHGAGVLFELDKDAEVAALLQAGGWTLLTGVNVMLFSLAHNPCSTTIYTIWKETRSVKWTAVATFMPLAMGVFMTFVIAQVWRLVESAM